LRRGIDSITARRGAKDSGKARADATGATHSAAGAVVAIYAAPGGPRHAPGRSVREVVQRLF
jgi:hypothetical protein